jgi:hypothetical protein
MPFSSLHNPDDLARAGRVLDAAWAKVKDRGLVSGEPEGERTRLAYVVASLLISRANDDELIDAVIARFLDQQEQEQ